MVPLYVESVICVIRLQKVVIILTSFTIRRMGTIA
jgi:hypothetical protein